jgi:hypothetical protein
MRAGIDENKNTCCREVPGRYNCPLWGLLLDLRGFNHKAPMRHALGLFRIMRNPQHSETRPHARVDQ